MGPPLLESFMNFAGPWLRRSTAGHHKIPGAVRGRGIFENEVYEGIPEVLAYLKEKGKILAVASSKPEKYVEQILEHFEIRKYFTVVTGSEMNGNQNRQRRSHRRDAAPTRSRRQPFRRGDGW